MNQENISDEFFKKIANLIQQKACPSIDGAIPPWPKDANKKPVWIGLHEHLFLYSHHSSHNDVIEDSHAVGSKIPRSITDMTFQNISDSLLCIPKSQYLKLLSILECSKGGSILVTGYRGTGKTSLVNYCINELIARKNERDEQDNSYFIPIRINLSTARNAMALVMLMIKELYMCSHSGRFDGRVSDLIKRSYDRFIGELTENKTVQTEHGNSYGVKTDANVLNLFKAAIKGDASNKNTHKDSNSYKLSSYSLHEAQQDLHQCLQELNKRKYKVIFIFDELDKLIPSNGTRISTENKLYEIQSVVSDLKFLLTESNAFNIFIAGKEVDDSWLEDQHKGEGLFESIFVQNIYNPSTLKAKFIPAIGPHLWISSHYKVWKDLHHRIPTIISRKKDLDAQLETQLRNETDEQNRKDLKRNSKQAYHQFFGKLFEPLFPEKFEKRTPELEEFSTRLYKKILNSFGINQDSWTYNTGLLILPHFSTSELWKIVISVSDQPFEYVNFKNEDKIQRQKLKEWALTEIINLITKDKPSLKYDYDAPEGKKKTFLDEDWKNIEKWIRFVYLCNLYFRTKDNHSRYNFIFDQTEPITERRRRRIRYLIQYLTYKGHGIPRKILREFYSIVNSKNIVENVDQTFWEKRGKIKYILNISPHLRKKIKFFANIVAILEEKSSFLRNLDDKGCVSAFYILDYILKFFKIGFSWTDIENANFMTQREEFYPSKILASYFLDFMDGFIIERLNRRNRTYMLLPSIKHDLSALFLLFGPEQNELRFTKADISIELTILEKKIAEVPNQEPTNRVESFKAQLRIARLYELLGNNLEARLQYSKALRWIRNDIIRYRALGTENHFTNATLITHISSAIRAALRIGYLYELDREFKTSLHYYNSALEFIIYASSFSRQEYSCLLDKSIDIKNHGVNGLRLPVKIVHQLYPYEDKEELVFFSDNISDIDLIKRPVSTYLEPIGIQDTLILIAINHEKLWQSHTCNKFLLLTYDYLLKKGDIQAALEHLIYIGEILVRRRDIGLAAQIYLFSLQEIANRFGSNTNNNLKSSMEAKLCEYLGDIYYATNGELFQLNYNQNNESLIDIIKKNPIISIFDNRDEELFYTQATFIYAMNNKRLKEADVLLKKSTIRMEKFFKILSDNNFEITEKINVNDLGILIQNWCSFWISIVKVLTILTDSDITLSGKDDSNLILLDRRLYAKALVMVGKIFLMLARRNVTYLFLAPEQFLEEGNIKTKIDKFAEKIDNDFLKTHCNFKSECEFEEAKNYFENDFKKNNRIILDLENTINLINSIMGLILRSGNSNLSTLYLAKDGEVGQKSLLWNLASTYWRKLCSDSGIDHPFRCKNNAYLIGQLFHIYRQIKEKEPEKQIDELDGRIESLYRSEISLLSAQLSLNDCIRDHDSAQASRAIGVLYLDAIEILLYLKKNSKKENSFLAYLYSQLHLAAKRYLFHALDMLFSENDTSRRIHHMIGETYRHLGDLMIIRAEVLYQNQSDSYDHNYNESFSDWSDLIKYLKLQKEHILDFDLIEVRYYAVRYYRKACRQYLNEIENYNNQYRFSNELYHFHNNIMDSKTHYEICSMINNRYLSTENKQLQKGHKNLLNKISKKMSNLLSGPYPSANEQTDWLKGFNDLFHMVNKIGLRDNYFFYIDSSSENYKIMFQSKPIEDRSWKYFFDRVKIGDKFDWMDNPM